MELSVNDVGSHHQNLLPITLQRTENGLLPFNFSREELVMNSLIKEAIWIPGEESQEEMIRTIIEQHGLSSLGIIVKSEFQPGVYEVSCLQELRANPRDLQCQGHTRLCYQNYY